MNIHKYMFSKRNFEGFIKKDTVGEMYGEPHDVPIIKKKKDEFIEPTYEDPLFWCFYILKYGILEYEMVENNDYKYKMQEYMKILNKTDDVKFKTDLMNEKNLSFKNFIKICKLESINLYMERNFFYSEMLFDDTCKNILKYKDEKYSVLKNCSEEDFKCLKKKCKVLDIEKPVQAFSNYKASDLRELGKKLKLDIMNGKKYKTKKEIYQMIHSKIE